MAFGHGKDARFYYNEVNLSQYLEEVDPEFTGDFAEIRPLTADSVRHVPGIRMATIALSGIYDAGEGSLGAQAWDAFSDGDSHLWSYMPQGDTREGVAYCGWSNLGSESITAGDDVVRMPVSLVGSDRFSRCTILHPLRAEASTSSATAHDNAAASTPGADAYLICTSATTATSLLVFLEHSSSDATYNTLGSFTTNTAAGEQSLVITGTINQYVRAAYTIVGAGGTFFVAFARR